jgi:AcrR family transcriptional regulator
MRARTPKPRRPPGRPRGADAAGRERLLDVAMPLFAERGIANTTVAQVAHACHVTAAMVHYWFETREKLLDAMVTERLAPEIRRVWEAVDPEHDDVLAMVSALVTRMLDVTGRMPWLPALWLREMALEGGALRERLFPHLPRERVLAFRRAVARAQSRSEVNAAVAPELLFISILALVMLPQATARIWHRVNPDITMDRAALERHVLALVTHGIAPPTRRKK